jgi:hypothetical protein
MSPSYYGCPECGDSEFWLLVDGRLMCANWPDCGTVLGDRWRADGAAGRAPTSLPTIPAPSEPP